MVSIFDDTVNNFSLDRIDGRGYYSNRIIEFFTVNRDSESECITVNFVEEEMVEFVVHFLHHLFESETHEEFISGNSLFDIDIFDDERESPIRFVVQMRISDSFGDSFGKESFKATYDIIRMNYLNGFLHFLAISFVRHDIREREEVTIGD